MCTTLSIRVYRHNTLHTLSGTGEGKSGKYRSLVEIETEAHPVHDSWDYNNTVVCCTSIHYLDIIQHLQ